MAEKAGESYKEEGGLEAKDKAEVTTARKRKGNRFSSPEVSWLRNKRA